MAKLSSPQPTAGFTWPTRSSTPIDVDDQAPVPLIVGIALALFIGFIIIVCCICRRRSLSSSSSSSNQESNAGYQRAPTADGTQTGPGFNPGVVGNSYPMAPVNSMYPPVQGQQALPGMTSQNVPGGMSIASHQQAPQHPYPSLPPNAYTPPYPIGYAPLPSYMPTSQSSSTPSCDHGPPGFSSSAPVPVSLGMTAVGNNDQTAVTTSGLTPQSMPPEFSAEGKETGVTNSGMGTHGYQQQHGVVYTNPQMGYGIQGQGMGLSGYQTTMMSQRGVMGMGIPQGSYSSQGFDKGSGMAQNFGTYSSAMHATAMDYVPGGGFIPRVGSPMPPGTTVTELDQL